MRHIRGPYLGVLMLLVSITSTQFGTSEAKFLMMKVGPEVTVALRLASATLLLFLALRPWRHVPRRGEWKSVLVYGVAIAFMNGCFYQAIARIPQGVAVAVEFSGPLLVAVCSSRRWTDYAGIVLAVAGLLLILPWTGLDAGLDLTGIAFALAAAAGWAGYIVFGRRAGGGGVCAAAWGMLAGTLVAVPWAAAVSDGTFLSRPDLFTDVLPLAFAVGFLASALLYWGMTARLGDRPAVTAAAMVLGLLVCYAFGTAWFLVAYARAAGPIGLWAALGMCVFPFVVPDLVKLALAWMLSRRLAGCLR